MPHDPKVCFLDIKTACECMLEFVGNMSSAEYCRDRKTKAAVEREFSIIGEALNRIKKINPDFLAGISHWQKIIGFRNILVHAYDALDDEEVYFFVVTDIPVLLKEVLEKL